MVWTLPRNTPDLSRFNLMLDDRLDETTGIVFVWIHVSFLLELSFCFLRSDVIYLSEANLPSIIDSLPKAYFVLARVKLDKIQHALRGRSSKMLPGTEFATTLYMK
jgi:hypothetical protein